MHETTPEIGHLGQQRLREFLRSLRSPPSTINIVSECNLHHQGLHSGDLWHATAIHDKEHDEQRGDPSPSLTWPDDVTWLRIFRAGERGRKQRGRGGEREKWRKKPAKFVTASFQRAITMFDTDCLITGPPPLHPILREMQFIVSLCRRAWERRVALRRRDWFYFRSGAFTSARFRKTTPVPCNKGMVFF